MAENQSQPFYSLEKVSYICIMLSVIELVSISLSFEIMIQLGCPFELQKFFFSDKINVHSCFSLKLSIKTSVFEEKKSTLDSQYICAYLLFEGSYKHTQT